MSTSFWQAAESLVRRYELIIDRPAGTAHPEYPSSIYPFDYGELVGTVSNDGEGVDVFVASGAERSLTAILLIHDPIKAQIEPKLVVGADAAEITTIVDFLTDVMRLEVLRIDRRP